MHELEGKGDAILDRGFATILSSSSPRPLRIFRQLAMGFFDVLLPPRPSHPSKEGQDGGRRAQRGSKAIASELIRTLFAWALEITRELTFRFCSSSWRTG